MSEAHVGLIEDSFVFMRTMMAGEVDVVLTDPPYSQHVHENLCSGSLVGTKAVPKYELPFAPLKDYAWLEDTVRIARRWVLSFCDVEAFGLIRGAVLEDYVRGGIWYKPNAMGQLTADRPATAYEGIAILHNSELKKAWNGRGSYGIWRCNGTRGKKDRHPNEKPMDLCRKLVALFSNRGETVFDPFCGSAAIGQACLELGRNYIGLDNDLAWVERARARLAGVHETWTDEAALKLCTMPKAAEVATGGLE
jgi:site-specific DNA-methyltransferase (adenine-specific)